MCVDCLSVFRESEKTKLLISQQTQKVVEKEAETERLKAVIGEILKMITSNWTIAFSPTSPHLSTPRVKLKPTEGQEGNQGPDFNYNYHFIEEI